MTLVSKNISVKSVNFFQDGTLTCIRRAFVVKKNTEPQRTNFYPSVCNSKKNYTFAAFFNYKLIKCISNEKNHLF